MANMACMASGAFAGLFIRSIRSLGSICREAPKWWRIQPQATGVPPEAKNLS